MKTIQINGKIHCAQGSEELLLKSDLRIKEIAFSCGFQTTSDFTRAFTKHFGLSPKAYCVQIKNKANEFLLSPET